MKFFITILFSLSLGTAIAQNYRIDYTYPDGYSLVYKESTEKVYGVINADKKLVVPMEYKAIRPVGVKGIFEIKDRSSNAGLYSAVLQKQLIGHHFYEIENFQEGLAVVKKRKPDYGFSWGAVDVNGNVIIPIEYDYLGSVNEGLLNFKKDNKYGFIDKTNKIIIPATYDDFSAFSNGLASAKTGEGKYGYIDKNNNLVIAARYEDADPFFDGYASVAKKKRYSMGGAGKQTVSVPGEYVLIDRTGKEINQKSYEKISSRFGGGLFVIESTGKKGVMDSTGQVILPVEYEQVQIDRNGNIVFKQVGKYGMVNSRGKAVLPAKYDLLSTNYDRYYAKLNEKYEVGDMSGKTLIPADSANGVILGRKRIIYYYNNKAKIFDLNGKLQKTFSDINLRNYGHSLSVTEDSIKLNGDATVQLINLATNIKRSLGFGEAGDFNEEGIFVGKRSNRFDFYDHTGRKLNTESYYTVVNFSEGIAALQTSSTSVPYLADRNFKKIKDLSLNFKGPYSDGLANAINGLNTSVYYLDKLGNEVFTKKSRAAGKSVAGFILITDYSGMYYHVNRTGKPISTKTWNTAHDFNEGVALVNEYGKWGFIDTLGNTVIPLNYDLGSSFTKGAAMVKQNGKFFLINKKGEPVNNNKYDLAASPGNGTFPVQKNGLVGLIDSRGNVLVDFKYSNITYMSEDRVWALKDGKWGLLDNKGKELTGFIYQAGYDFDNGYARVALNDKFGLVNKAGKLILPTEYKSLGSVYKGNIIGIKQAETLVYSLK